jgi:hypothetical protein
MRPVGALPVCRANDPRSLRHVTGGDALQANDAVPSMKWQSGFSIERPSIIISNQGQQLIHHNPDTRFETRIGDDFAALDGHCQVADKAFDLEKRQRGNIGSRKVGWLPVASRKPITRQPVTVHQAPALRGIRANGLTATYPHKIVGARRFLW